MELFVFGVFGAIVGSFLNVVVARHGTGRGLGGRSSCDACGRELSWHHLVPVVSWIALRARCGYCRTRLSAQYPLVELLTAGLFVGVGAAQLPFIATGAALGAVALLLAISVYDMHHTIIPDMWAALFAACAFIFGYLAMLPQNIEAWFFFLASGVFAALPLFALWFVSKGTWTGLGDAKLALGIGWLLGPYWGIVAIYGGFAIGAVISLFILLPSQLILHALHSHSLEKRTKGFTMKSEVPFGPFLACSCYIIWLLVFVGNIQPIPLW